MKILILYPNFYGMNMLPPAVGLFTAILKKEGHEVALFDSTIYEHVEGFNNIDFDKKKAKELNARAYDDTIIREHIKNSNCLLDFKAKVESFQPGLIAMSCTEDMYPLGVTILKSLGKERPTVVAGGIFPTSSPDLTIDFSEETVDYVLTGEGENSLPEFIRRLEKGGDLKISMKTVEGICYYTDKNKLHKNPLPATVDVNRLELPDYFLFEESRYYRPMQGKVWRMFPIETHRGCPYTCAYCNSPTTMDIYKAENQKFFRKKTIKNVEAEIIHCIKNYKADSFYFWADTFLAWTGEEFNEFCDMYKSYKLPFWIQTRPETITEDRVKRLKEVGILRIAFGLEHGNEKFRETMLSRKIKNRQIIEKLEIVSKYEIPYSVNNIMGFPGETRELVFDTIELNRQIKADGHNAYTFTPFHGTPLREVAENMGLITKEELSRCIGEPSVLNMAQFTPDQIEGIRRCFVLYVKMPKSRWPDIEKAEKLTSEGDRIYQQLLTECSTSYMD